MFLFLVVYVIVSLGFYSFYEDICYSRKEKFKTFLSGLYWPFALGRIIALKVMDSYKKEKIELSELVAYYEEIKDKKACKQ